jgi:hypothetical protein
MPASPHDAPRPWYLTVVSILVIITGVSMNVAFLTSTLGALSAGRGPWLPVAFMCFMHVVWTAFIVCGVGLFKGATWGRPLLIASLLAMTVATIAPSWTKTGDQLMGKLIVYPLIIWAAFTRRSSAYFASEASESSGMNWVEPTQ